MRGCRVFGMQRRALATDVGGDDGGDVFRGFGDGWCAVKRMTAVEYRVLRIFDAGMARATPADAEMELAYRTVAERYPVDFDGASDEIVVTEIGRLAMACYRASEPEPMALD
jgi:hypothetical protein